MSCWSSLLKLGCCNHSPSSPPLSRIRQCTLLRGNLVLFVCFLFVLFCLFVLIVLFVYSCVHSATDKALVLAETHPV